MGIFDFVRDAGAKVGLGESPAKAVPPTMRAASAAEIVSIFMTSFLARPAPLNWRGRRSLSFPRKRADCAEYDCDPRTGAAACGCRAPAH